MDSSELECTREDRVSQSRLLKFLTSSVFLGLVCLLVLGILIISIIMILHTNSCLHKWCKAKKSDDLDISTTNSELDQLHMEALATTRRVQIEALLRIATFFFYWTPPVLSSMGLLSTSGDGFRPISQPLQGFAYSLHAFLSTPKVSCIRINEKVV